MPKPKSKRSTKGSRKARDRKKPKLTSTERRARSLKRRRRERQELHGAERGRTFTSTPCPTCGDVRRYVASNACPSCTRETARKKYARNPKREHQRVVDYYKRHPKRLRENGRRVRNWKRAKLIGLQSLGPDQGREVVEALVKSSPDRCPICGEKADRFDHCHRRNRFRGMLCDRCNKGLGGFLDSPALLRKAADYVEGREERFDLDDRFEECMEQMELDAQAEGREVNRHERALEDEYFDAQPSGGLKRRRRV